jgi:hypothetical protein
MDIKSHVMSSCQRRHIYKKIDFLRPYRESILRFKVNILGTSSQIFTIKLKLNTDVFTKTMQVLKIYKLPEAIKIICIQRTLRVCVFRGFSLSLATFFSLNLLKYQNNYRD